MILFLIALFLFLQTTFNLGKMPINLACGLGGYNGSVPPTEMFLRIIGKYNEKRGVHSCGISNDFKTIHGVDKEKVFSDFSETLPSLGTYKKTNNVILHTRWATMGKHTKSNAHPFGFGICGKDSKNNNQYKFVGVHNGSLYEWDELVKPFSKNIRKNLDLDSKALLYNIYANKNFKVLSEYKGAAALLFYSQEEPDVLYAYKGAAGDSEERPLYYVQVKDANDKIIGAYFSSMQEPFKFGGFTETQIIKVPNNTVLKFKGGEIIAETKIKRKASLHEDYFKYSTYTNKYTPAQKSLDIGYSQYAGYSLGGGSSKSTFQSSKTNKTTPKNTSLIPSNTNRTTPNSVKSTELFNSLEKILGQRIVGKEVVTFKYTRHMLNDRLLNGIYFLDKCGRPKYDAGFDKYDCAKKEYDKLENSEKKDYKIYAFHKGLMLKDPSEYFTVKTKEEVAEYKNYINHPFVMVTGNKLSNFKASSYVFLPYDIAFYGEGSEKYPYWFTSDFSPFKYYVTSSRILDKVNIKKFATPYTRFICARAAQIICDIVDREISYSVDTFNAAKTILKCFESIELSYQNPEFTKLTNKAYTFINSEVDLEDDEAVEEVQTVDNLINDRFEKGAEPSETNEENKLLKAMILNTSFKKGYEHYLSTITFLFGEFLDIHSITNTNPDLLSLEYQIIEALEKLMTHKFKLKKNCDKLGVDADIIYKITKFLITYKKMIPVRNTKMMELKD